MPNTPTAYKGTEPYIFISYAHKDSETILPLIQGLQDRGFRVWYDAGIEAGTEWPEYIAEHLNGSACVIAFISRNSVESHNCRREINFAIELRKEPLVIYMEHLDLPLGLRMQLGTLHALFYRRHTSDTSFLDALAEAEALQPCRAKATPAKPAVPEPMVFVKQKPAKQEISLEECLEKADAARKASKYSEAAKLYRQAADQDSAAGMFGLALCYNASAFWSDANPTEAAKWTAKAAHKGHAEAQAKLGELYSNGSGVPKDLSEAVKWFRAAAEQDHGYAQIQMGKCLEQGLGIPKNFEQALKWYEKAAAKGYVEAKKGVERCQSKLKNPLSRFFG